jgi:hypothetical protein
MRDGFEDFEDDQEERNDSEYDREDINNFHINKESGKVIIIKNLDCPHLVLKNSNS